VSIALVVGFAGVVTLAAVFAAWPAWTRTGRGRAVLAAAIALFVTGVGLGTYLMVGEPILALRSAQGARTRDINGLIALLVDRVHKSPEDTRAWVFLGRAYLTVGDSADAAKALARAVALEEKARHPGAELYSAYGEALVGAAGNAVSPEAEAAFAKALALDPKNDAARYYLGLAHAARGESAKALGLWQSLLADTPAGAAYRQELIDRIAALTASTGAAPDPAAMTAGLAARLKEQPHDAAGWRRLVRAYSVLGEKAKARAALAEGRKALANDRDALSSLEAEASALKLDR
jgi:cytochrome c-type biogenesis protein CcmH